MVPDVKKIEIIIGIHVYLIWQMNFDSMENGQKIKFLLPNQSINIMYQNEENMFMVPNHRKNKDYYENPSSFPLINELW